LEPAAPAHSSACTAEAAVAAKLVVRHCSVNGWSLLLATDAAGHLRLRARTTVEVVDEPTPLLLLLLLPLTPRILPVLVRRTGAADGWARHRHGTEDRWAARVRRLS